MSPLIPTREYTRTSSCTMCGGPIRSKGIGRQPEVCSPECRRARDAARKRIRRRPAKVSLAEYLRAAYPDGRPDVSAFTDAEWADIQRIAAEQYPDARSDSDMDAAHRGLVLTAIRGDIVTEADFDTLHYDDDSGSQPGAYTRSSYYDKNTGTERPTADWRGYSRPPSAKTAIETDPASAWLVAHDPDAFRQWCHDGLPMTNE